MLTFEHLLYISGYLDTLPRIKPQKEAYLGKMSQFYAWALRIQILTFAVVVSTTLLSMRSHLVPTRNLMTLLPA